MARIITEGAVGELTEKKSKFIATIRPVSTEEEALSFVSEMKKKYYDARHNCSAYLLGHPPVSHSSDDGEPSGTAGRPMLDVLTGADLTDVACVVTRYFGGVLLGTGGLVRAYSGAVQEALSHCTFAETSSGIAMDITLSYEAMGKVDYILREQSVPVLNTRFEEAIIFTVFLTPDQKEGIKKLITEATAGKAMFGDESPMIYTSNSKSP